VHRVEAFGSRDGRPGYRVRVVPALERLRHRRRCRIFQDQVVPKIVKTLLDELHVEHRWSLSGTCSPREYCVQYRETDLEFLSRLLEEEGLFYFFEHLDSGHVLVLGDGASAFRALAGGASLPLVESGGLVPGKEHVHALAELRQVRPGAVVVRDYDFLKPEVDRTASARASGGSTSLEVYEYPAPERAGRVRLEELQRDARTLEGASACPRLLPGSLLEVEGGPAGRLLVTEVRHSARGPEGLGPRGRPPELLYRNAFCCLPPGVPFRPPRSTPRPVVGGIQTAMVVGPAGEEIHPDAHGRIKVQFHWDREGRKDDRSSCWIRVGQPWSGPGWGGLLLPRVGQEVVVRFLEGDPDRPLVTGAVYNGRNVPPLELPAERTKSTLRSSSSKGGDGANELRFEDAAGAEELYLHAQRDLTLVVENDKRQTVGGSETLKVKKDRERVIEGNQSLEIHKDDESTIQGSQALHVVGDRATTVDGDHTEKVGGKQTRQVGGDLALSVAKDATERVGGDRQVSVEGDCKVTVGKGRVEKVGGDRAERVGGTRTEQVDGDRSEQVQGARSLQVGGDLTEEVQGARSLKVERDLLASVGGGLRQAIRGACTLSARELTVVAQEQLTLKIGPATLQVGRGGDVILDGTRLELSASGPIVLAAPIISEN
jgi:type VI secretion system secreted protein VgrG